MEATVTQNGILQADGIEIRPHEFVALAGGKPLELTVRELDLLIALVERSGRIVSREELYRVVWGESYRKADRSVDVYVGKLRHKLGMALPERRFIHTHFGFGYRFVRAPSLHTFFTRGRHPGNRLTPHPMTASDPSMNEFKEKTCMRKLLALAACGVLALGAAACGDDDSSGEASADGGSVSGSIAIDGSSTVAPFAQAAQEAFQAENPDVKITVGTAGTGGGFEKFCAGETDISNASRPIKDDEEVPVCKKNNVVYDEVQVANDGIAVVTNTALKVDCLTVDELKKMWNKGSKVKSLSEVNPELSDTELTLFGPGTDSGTFDFFTDQINGEEGVSRDDYQPSEDDNILVQGVEGSEGGLGYFGFSYYEQNQDKLNLVGVDGGDGCVKPSTEAIQDGSYTPLSRPLFMYPSEKALKRPEVKAFMDYVIANYSDIATAAQIVPMTDAQAAEGKKALESAESNAGA